jgi:hypothetical protein
LTLAATLLPHLSRDARSIGIGVLASALLLCACSNCARPDRNLPSSVPSKPLQGDSSPGPTTIRVDSVSPTAKRKVTSGESDRKFVKVVVRDVVNPRRLELVFEVHFRGDAGNLAFLGTFGLFPSDNPGTFIVPARGLLREGGEVLVTLKLPPDSQTDDVSVSLGAITFEDSK